MSYTITIGGQSFKDLATVGTVAAGAKDGPDILRAVRLTVLGEVIKAEATDSYRLVIMHRDVIEIAGDYANMAPVLIEATALTRAAKSFKPRGRKLGDVTFTFEEGGAFTVTDGADVFGGQLVEGTYPDLARAIPAFEGIAAADRACFNPSFLADFAKVAPFNAKDATATAAIKSLPSDGRPMRIESMDGRTVGVIMPVRVI